MKKFGVENLLTKILGKIHILLIFLSNNIKIKNNAEKFRNDLGSLPNLAFEKSFNKNGVKGRLDCIDDHNKIIYDFKFGATGAKDGQTGMMKTQYDKYSKAFPGYKIKTINKKGKIKDVNKDTFRKK